MKNISLFLTLTFLSVAIVYGTLVDETPDDQLLEHASHLDDHSGKELFVPRYKRSGIDCIAACAAQGKSGGTCRKCPGYKSRACGDGWVCVCKGVTNYCN